MPYEEEDTCMSYEEEDTCMSYEEEDACHMRRRIHTWSMKAPRSAAISISTRCLISHAVL